MRTRGIVFSAVCLVGWTVACGSFGESTAKPPAPASGDGGDGGGEVVPSPTLDGGAADATLPPASWCATHRMVHTIACTDFDEDAKVGDWDGVSQEGDASFWLPGTPNLGAAPSGPDVATAQIGNPSQPPNDRARLTKAIRSTATHTTLTFSIRLATPALDNENQFVSIGEVLCGEEGLGSDDPNAIDGVFLQVRKANGVPTLELLVGKTYEEKGTAVLPLDAWTQVVFDIDWSAVEFVMMTLTVDGVVVASLVPAQSSCAGSSTWRAVAGLSSNVPTSAEYDNVSLDAY